MTAIKLQRQSSVRIPDEPDRTLADPFTRGFAQGWRLGVARLICVLSDNRLMSVTEHRADAPLSVRCAVITVSDTRTDATDTSGRAIADLLSEHRHGVVYRAIVPDEQVRIRAALDEMVAREDVDVVLMTGGTGISRRDGTYEVVNARIEKRLDGFGELFRMLSYADVGPAAMLSRACAGLASATIVIAMPGSEAAVRLAMQKLLLPELGHLVREARR